MKSLALAWITLAGAAAAHAESTCRLVEISFRPTANLQIAVWVEDAQGHFVDTAYVTRATGALGIANRPGNALLKSAFRWPYGRRVMVLPVWAHRRNHQYGYVVMGGSSGIDPHDDTIGYHEAYSSGEPFFCAPSNAPLDAVSCASTATLSKGRYAPGQTSPYPPRADLTGFGSADSDDARGFAATNDVAVVSGATPRGGQLVTPAISWVAPASAPTGSYRVRIEASLEGDFDDAHRHPAFPDPNAELRDFGAEIFGQPSIVYSVPFVLDGSLHTSTSDGWDGYGSWDGADGELRAPDGTISEQPDSGAGRLHHVTDGDGTWRVKVITGSCAECAAPLPTGPLALSVADTRITATFAAPPQTGALGGARRYDFRYRAGELDDASFADGIPVDASITPAAPGTPQTVMVTGLKPEIRYTLGVRALNACGTPSPGQFASATTTKVQYVVLHGCFVATAAYGTPMASELGALRRWRDRALLSNPIGRLAVAAYYSLSLPLARAISSDERLRALARGALAPAVKLARAWNLAEDSRR